MANVVRQRGISRGTAKLHGSIAMWMVAAQLCAIYLLSTIPTPLYALYRARFGFSSIMLAIIYAVYVIGTVITMFVFGHLSDEIGRRRVVLISLAVAAASAVVFFFARNTAMLFPARILSGLAIALSAGASTAWITELEPGQDKNRATQITIGANVLGLGLGPLMAGILAQYAPLPLRLSYLIFLGILAAGAAATWGVEESLAKSKPLKKASLRLRLGVPEEIRACFIPPAVSTFATFAVLGFYTALLPNLLNHAFGMKGPAIAGYVLGGFFILGTVAIAATTTLQARRGMIASLILLIPGIALLAISEAMQSLPLFLIAAIIGGIATGLSYRFTLQVVNGIAPEDRRAEVVSAYLIVCYCGISLPVIGVALLSAATSRPTADSAFAGIIALLAVVALVTELRLGGERNAQTS